MILPRVRFTVRRMMVAVAIVAFALFVYRTLGRAAIPLGVVGLPIAGVCHHWARTRPRWTAWGFWASALAINLFVAALDTYALCLGGLVMMAVLALLGFSLALGLGSAWATGLAASGRDSAATVALAWAVIVAIAPITMAIDSWPLRLACLISRPAMDRLADRVSAGEPVAWPVDAGLFTIVGSEFDPVTRCVGLITDPDPSGRSGFVRHIPELTGERRLGPFRNLNFNVEVGRGWWYQNED
jgi:hypothetical protein